MRAQTGTVVTAHVWRGIRPVIMTGDDAIEMAYVARPAKLGWQIGVNVRLARYTEVQQSYIDRVRPALQAAARRYNVRLTALPTSSHPQEANIEIIRQLLKDCGRVSIDWPRFYLPLSLIHQVGRYRLVVTGSYHTAVFALAQGIPAVGLAKSTTYINKFSALQDEFGPALQLVHLDDGQLTDTLTSAIDLACRSADDAGCELLPAAARQIDWGMAGYRELYNRMVAREGGPRLDTGWPSSAQAQG